MRQLIILIILLAGYNYCTNAQTGVAINTAGTMAHNSAMLDVKSDNKGMLIPRVSTSARNAINNPAAGLLVFDSTEKTIYMFDGNRWMGFQPMPDKIRPISTLVFPPNPEDTMFAGFCTSVSNEFAVVGAPYKGGLTGGAFVYRFNGDTWQHFTTLVPTSGNTDTAMFGMAVNVSGNNMIIGAPMKKNGSGLPVGAAYVYSFNGSSWVNTDILYGSMTGTSFATAVEINDAGTTLAISEPGANVGIYNGAGVVKIYNKIFSWSFMGNIQDPTPAIGAGFGETMALSPSGNYITIGAPNKTINASTNQGQATAFKRVGLAWNFVKSVTGDIVNGNQTGLMLDITDTKWLIVMPGTKKAVCFDIEGPYNQFTYTYTNFIDGAGLDPVTNEWYIWSSPTIFRSGDYFSRSISTTNAGYGLPRMFSVYNKRFVLGSPIDSPGNLILAGGFYLGTVD